MVRVVKREKKKKKLCWICRDMVEEGWSLLEAGSEEMKGMDFVNHYDNTTERSSLVLVNSGAQSSAELAPNYSRNT